jgi:S-DNA-T family DNA segregation ATPase FtsK/SpoIIIE
MRYLLTRAAIIAALALAVAVYRYRHPIITAGLIGLVLIAVWLSCRLVAAVTRFALAGSAARRNYPRAWWARARWRWLTRNLELAYLDQHRRAKRPARLPGSTAASVRHPSGVYRLRYPRATFRADPYGLVATVRTVPGVGRAEFDKQAAHIANAWGVHRVQVSQRKPGRLVIRGLRTDPLTEPLPGRDLSSARLSADPWSVYLGRDEWGTDRRLDLTGLTGITIGGLPGYGKSALVGWLLCQLAATAAVQLVIIDGKGGGDYADWAERAWLFTGDELPEAATVLEDVHSLMRSRLASVVEQTGHRNGWHAGPSERFPLIVTVLDECHTFMDIEAVKGDRQAEAHVRTCRALTGQLVKKGRSALFLTLLLTQKQTADAIPTAIRDNCGLGLSFAVKTADAAVAGLGDSIRQYPSYCPTRLQERPAYVGVCTASLPTGGDPFVRLRVPELTEAASAARALETACHRRNPVVTAELLAAPSPSVGTELAHDDAA